MFGEGERGPKGDHGQGGHDGEQGPAGPQGPKGEKGKSFFDVAPGTMGERTKGYLIAIGLALLVLGVTEIRSSNRDAENDKTVEQQITSRIEGCERSKQDRIQNARAWTSNVIYLSGVLDAASVKQDVKDAATKNIKAQRKSAAQLRKNLLLCEPLIRDDEKVMDEKALKEALGKPQSPLQAEGK